MTEKDYDAAAEWAEHDMTLHRRSGTARRGADAAAFGRELVERSQGGRPPWSTTREGPCTPSGWNSDRGSGNAGPASSENW